MLLGYTGNIKIEKRFLGGFNIYVEIEFDITDPENPMRDIVRRKFIKATKKEFGEALNAFRRNELKTALKKLEIYKSSVGYYNKESDKSIKMLAKEYDINLGKD